MLLPHTTTHLRLVPAAEGAAADEPHTEPRLPRRRLSRGELDFFRLLYGGSVPVTRVGKFYLIHLDRADPATRDRRARDVEAAYGPDAPPDRRQVAAEGGALLWRTEGEPTYLRTLSEILKSGEKR